MLTRCVYSSCGSVQREVYMQGFVHVKFSPLNVLRLQICGSIGTLTFRFITAEICLNTFLFISFILSTVLKLIGCGPM